MRKVVPLPDLTFPEVEFGPAETPWNLNVLLYTKGAATRPNLITELILNQTLGAPLLERLPLVSKLHEEMRATLGSGGSRSTAANQIRSLRYFFSFADRTHHPLTLETASDAFCIWSDSLFHRTRQDKQSQQNQGSVSGGYLSMQSAYIYASYVAALLDRVLERRTGIIELTRLEMPPRRKSAVGILAEKQNLSNTFVFGHLLQDICDALTIQTVLETPFPVEIRLRNGKTLTRHSNWGRQPLVQNAQLAARSTLVNLRIESEMMMFIGQTGMNLAEAHHLKLHHFFYVSHLDGYQVKEYKNRRGGTVLFEIFKDYKPHFERYLEWRRKLFPDSIRLFPFIAYEGSRAERDFDGVRVRRACEALDLPYVPPRSLRNTRVNWLLRKTGDPNLTAEIAQHTKEILLKVYERPSLQRAMVEVTRFWSALDPHSDKTQAVALGNCTGTPQVIADMPESAPKPDCTRASGCLWCENHRDIDSLDYVWALATFSHLKVIELSKAALPQREEPAPPAKSAIDRIQEKLRWFELSNERRRKWVIEASARVSEGDFHPALEEEISELEGAT
jgi:hypothetical protein